MKVIVQILIKFLVRFTCIIATKNLEISNNREESFVLALYLVIKDVYVPQSDTIFITQSSIRPDSKQNVILENLLALLDHEATVTWTINDHRYLNNSMERMNNIVIVDSYKSWR